MGKMDDFFGFTSNYRIADIANYIQEYMFKSKFSVEFIEILYNEDEIIIVYENFLITIDEGENITIICQPSLSFFDKDELISKMDMLFDNVDVEYVN